MRETRAGTPPSITLEKGLAVFLDALAGKNRSAATIRAYQTDLLQFIHFLHDTDVLIATPQDVQKVDILDYFSYLAKKDLTGVARARKMSAIREYFRILLANLFPRDIAAIAALDAPGSCTFSNGICEAQFAALGGSPTVSGRFLAPPVALVLVPAWARPHPSAWRPIRVDTPAPPLYTRPHALGDRLWLPRSLGARQL
jgi:integrase family protein with SAM-like domain